MARLTAAPRYLTRRFRKLGGKKGPSLGGKEGKAPEKQKQKVTINCESVSCDGLSKDSTKSKKKGKKNFQELD